MSNFPKSTQPLPTLGEFLVDAPAEILTGGIITQQQFEARRAKTGPKRADGTERKQFKDLDAEDKLDYLYTSSQQTQCDVLENSIRLYGVKRNDAKGVNPTEILRRVCYEGLKLSNADTELITNSALRFIQRVESGKCIVFQLNRVDLIRKIFENIGNLKDFENPYNRRTKIVFTRNLCPEDNRIRSECLSIKELLREKGFRDIKIRFNKLISVNGGQWHEYSWFLEHKYEDADQREKQIAEKQGSSSGGTGTVQKAKESYAAIARKRKGQEHQEDTAEQGDISSNASPSRSEAHSAPPTATTSKPKKQRPTKKPRH